LFDQFHTYRDHLGKNNKSLFVYHGSTSKALKAIAKQGFLEPKELAHMSDSISTLDPGYFGHGIYQGFAADYAIHYAERYKNSDKILLSIVLPGRSYIVKKGGEKYGQDCEPGFDSHISPESKEIVLFQSAQILPLFIIRFKRIPNAKITEEPY
jgi:aprataxin and PNK-like factor